MVKKKIFYSVTVGHLLTKWFWFRCNEQKHLRCARVRIRSTCAGSRISWRGWRLGLTENEESLADGPNRSSLVVNWFSQNKLDTDAVHHQTQNTPKINLRPNMKPCFWLLVLPTSETAYATRNWSRLQSQRPATNRVLVDSYVRTNTVSSSLDLHATNAEE